MDLLHDVLVRLLPRSLFLADVELIAAYGKFLEAGLLVSVTDPTVVQKEVELLLCSVKQVLFKHFITILYIRLTTKIWGNINLHGAGKK